MITPAFKVTQDEEFVYVDVKISSIRFSAAGLEMVVNGNVFIFHISPYYLRLRFPHNLVDDERATAEYKAATESIWIKLPKETHGQFFEDLDLVTKLLARQADDSHSQKEKTQGPLIQDLDASFDDSALKRQQSLRHDGETFNWEIRQDINDSDTKIVIRNKYGFDNKYNSVIGVSIANGNDINELDSPETSTPNERVRERLRKENLKFDPEYYLGELMTYRHGSVEEKEINGIESCINFVPLLVKDYLRWYKKAENKNTPMPLEFEPKELEQMQKNLPKKEYLVEDTKPLYITMINVLFAYLFEQMENEGSHNAESAWTIGKLAPQIAFLDQQLIYKEEEKPLLVQVTDSHSNERSLIQASIKTGIRRSLSYPLHRNFDLSMKAWRFVYYLLRAGKRTIIRALLDIHEVFRFHDVYYVYNKILLDDLCSWFISQGSPEIIANLANEVKKEFDNISKSDINFDCISGFDSTSGEPSWENMTLKEMEILAEAEFTDN